MFFELNSFTIDVIFLIFCLFFIFIGYSKGFIRRAYDFLGTIIAIVLAFLTSEPLSRMYQFFSHNEFIDTIIVDVFNRLVAFVVLFIFFWVIKKILGLIMKPLLQNIVSFLSLTDFINRILGVLLSLVEVFIIAYFALSFMLPMIQNGDELIDNTIITKNIIEIVPEISDTISSWSGQYLSLLDSHVEIDENDILIFLLDSYQLRIVNEEQMIDIFENGLYEYLLESEYTLDDEQRILFLNLIEKTSLDENVKVNIIDKVGE